MSKDLEAQKKDLKEDLEKLKREFKVELPKRIAEARAYGDLKENAEYDAARERQAFVKARISQLNENLSRLNDMNVSEIPEDKIGFGSMITAIDLDSDDSIEFTLVSSSEVNPSEGKISLSSPIGVALINHAAGDEISLNIPAGKRRYYIEKIVTIQGNIFEVKR